MDRSISPLCFFELHIIPPYRAQYILIDCISGHTAELLILIHYSNRTTHRVDQKKKKKKITNYSWKHTSKNVFSKYPSFVDASYMLRVLGLKYNLHFIILYPRNVSSCFMSFHCV